MLTKQNSECKPQITHQLKPTLLFFLLCCFQALVFGQIDQRLLDPFPLPPLHAIGHALVEVSPEFLGEYPYDHCLQETRRSLHIEIEWFHTQREDLLELTTSQGVSLTYLRFASDNRQGAASLAKHWVKGKDCVGNLSSPPLRTVDPGQAPLLLPLYAPQAPVSISRTTRSPKGTLVEAIQHQSTTATSGAAETILEFIFDEQLRPVERRVVTKLTTPEGNSCSALAFESQFGTYHPAIPLFPTQISTRRYEVPPSFLKRYYSDAAFREASDKDPCASVKLVQPAVRYEITFTSVEKLPEPSSLEALAEQRSKGMRLRTDQSLAQLKLPEEAAAKTPYRPPKSAARSFLERWGLALGVACLAAAATTATVLLIRRKE